MRHVVAMDLDGTILDYHGWKLSGGKFENPLEGALLTIHDLISRGHKVVVFSARTEFQAVQDFLVDQGFPRLPVTNIKQRDFTVILDDRNFRTFHPDMYKDRAKLIEEIEAFQPWWKRRGE